MNIIDKFGEKLNVKADVLQLQGLNGSPKTETINLEKIKYVVLTHLYSRLNSSVGGTSVNTDPSVIKMYFTPSSTGDTFTIGLGYSDLKVKVTENSLSITVDGGGGTNSTITSVFNYEIYYEE